MDYFQSNPLAGGFFSGFLWHFYCRFFCLGIDSFQVVRKRLDKALEKFRVDIGRMAEVFITFGRRYDRSLST